MSDEVKKTSSLPVDSQMPGSTGKGLALPISAVPARYASKADEILVRLNKLIKTTAGLGSLLSFVSYSLYIATYLHNNSPARAQIIAKISQLLGRPVSKLPAAALKSSPPGASPFQPIIALINETRFSMRLIGLIPLYTLLRTLVRNKNPKDAWLHRFALIQASSYIGFQIFENLWLLSNRNILSAGWMEKRGGAAAMMKVSCRAWFVALMMEYARLGREAYIAKETGAANNMTKEEQERVEKKWWAEFFTTSAWIPMAIHYSIDAGIGMNLGMVGLSGMLGGLGGLSSAWVATKE